jgi:hypothetical protein
VNVDRPFLGANVLFSAARSTTSRLRSLWTLSDLQLLSSALAVEEAKRNLALDRPASLSELDLLVTAITIVAEPDASLSLPAQISLPEKDRPLFLSAVQANATHFVTGDKKHFGAYRGQIIAGVTILSPSDYLASRKT